MQDTDQIPDLESVNDGVNVEWEQQMELNRKSLKLKIIKILNSIQVLLHHQSNHKDHW